jgi:hypothetical protein
MFGEFKDCYYENVDEVVDDVDEDYVVGFVKVHNDNE